jgi:hypothetical protein
MEPVPFGVYRERENIFKEEMDALRSQKEASGTVARIFLGISAMVILFLSWKWYAEESWEVTYDSPIICLKHPKLFGSDRYYYVWTRDRNGERGYVEVHPDGSPADDATVTSEEFFPKPAP